MEVFVDNQGRRVFVNSPLVDQASMKRNVILYDPNGYNLDCGLYARPQPACERWVDHFYQFEKKHQVPPLYSVDQNGNTYYSNIKLPQFTYRR